MEMALVLAVLVQDWDFDLVPGQQIRPNPAMTLRSNRPIEMSVHNATNALGLPLPDAGQVGRNGSSPHAC